MVRTQIQLTPDQAEKVRRLAAERGMSMAAVIRALIDEHMVRLDKTTASLRDTIRRMPDFRSGNGDISSRHDDYLDDAFGT